MECKHPRLEYLMSCYYHQDWIDEIESDDDKALWAFFFAEEHIAHDQDLEDDIKALLATREDNILRTLDNYQSDGRCWKSPADAKQWLSALYEFVRAKNSP